ncbi:hemerythrin domain-containing protein [Nonomuraea phyllanthi]|nr:hemerythrin domain-containing protein [Nonomuraea phyllanthi]
MTGDARDERRASMRRRALLGMPVVLTGCGAVREVNRVAREQGIELSPTPTRTPTKTPTSGGGKAGEEEEVTPPEDLMREHGVLKRVLLIYREGIRRIRRDQQVPARELHAGAGIIRNFIEEYHERLEERYVFPPLVKAGKLADTVSVLVTQHQRGRVLTGRILEATAGPVSEQGRRELVADMGAFIKMYEPHEAREDTVVFPALRDVVPPAEFARMGEIFEDEEHRRFGAAGFTGVVQQVADIEKALGIYNLAQFTPRI